MGIVSTRTELGPHFSEGARLLWVFMESRGMSQGALMRLLGTKAGVIPRWLYGVTRPGLDWAMKVRDALGIAPEEWTRDPTAPFVPPAARADESGELTAVSADVAATSDDAA